MKTGLLLPLILGSFLVVFGVSAAMESEKAEKPATEGQATAIFAGGCFWCTEADFEKVPGVSEAISGYTGGEKDNPTYKQVSSGQTAHVEAVQVFYDPEQVSYQQLLAVYWRHIDPTDPAGQFVDRGKQYRPVIFVADETERAAAEQSRKALEEKGLYEKPLTVEITPASRFWPAEDYHQDYYKRNPIRYTYYRSRSGRDQYLEKIWGDDLKVDFAKVKAMDASTSMSDEAPAVQYTRPDEETLRQTLTPLQYEVTQEDATERPFDNTYWDEKRAGIYVDVVSGEPLFSSTDKYKSGTGWPSFTRPLKPEHIVERKDFKLFFPRTEVRSKYGDSHLGHVFKDGPEPTGLRYCINSAALRFVPKEELAAAGYGQFAYLFK